MVFGRFLHSLLGEKVLFVLGIFDLAERLIEPVVFVFLFSQAVLVKSKTALVKVFVSVTHALLVRFLVVFVVAMYFVTPLLV